MIVNGLYCLSFCLSPATGFQLHLLGGLGMKWQVSREEKEGSGLTNESWLCNNFSTSSIRGSLRDGGHENCSILNMLGLRLSLEPNLYTYVLAG